MNSNFQEYKLKEPLSPNYEQATESRKLFAHCLLAVPHIFLEATKKKWTQLLRKRNQQN